MLKLQERCLAPDQECRLTTRDNLRHENSHPKARKQANRSKIEVRLPVSSEIGKIGSAITMGRHLGICFGSLVVQWRSIESTYGSSLGKRHCLLLSRHHSCVGALVIRRGKFRRCSSGTTCVDGSGQSIQVRQQLWEAVAQSWCRVWHFRDA